MRTLARAMIGGVVGVVLAMLVLSAAAQEVPPSPPPSPPSPPADTAAQLGDPVLNESAQLRANRATAWQEGGEDGEAGERWLLLDGDVTVRVGAYGFRGTRAVVRIQTTQELGGTVRRLAAVVQDARPLTGESRVQAEASRLLVTAATDKAVELETDLLERVEGGPPRDPLVIAARERIAERDEALARPMLGVPDRPLFSEAELTQRRTDREALAERVAQRDVRLPDAPPASDDQDDTPAAEARRSTAGPIVPTRGTFRWSGADYLDVRREEDSTAIMLLGDVRVMFDDREANRSMVMTAERVVVFLEPTDEDAEPTTAGGLGEGLDASRVRGVYLEDNAVITDGQYTVRAPRVYYDVIDDRAILLDAVLFAYDTQRNIPLYMRADVLQQTARGQFRARKATLTTSEFGKPHFGIGVGKLKVAQLETDTGDIRRSFTARDVTLRARGLPLFYLPWLGGTDQALPIRGVGFGYDENNGVQLFSSWDLFALAGQPRPEGVDAVGLFDYRGEHGPAIGLNLDYNRPAYFGELSGYWLPIDDGTDTVGGRRDIEFDSESRGFARLQHRQLLPDDWELSLEAGYVSDPTFLEEFYREEAYSEKPYETSIYLKKAWGSAAFTALGEWHPNDFITNLSYLETPGFLVERAPELALLVEGGELFDGRVSWFSENRYTRLRADFPEVSPGDYGFQAGPSQRLFGIGVDTSFEDAADAAGFPQEWINRFDTRQEIDLPLQAGPVDITPYAVGRVTAYDEGFEDFNGGNDDQIRLWGAVGVRTGVDLHKTYDGFRSRVFDVEGLRHVIRPEVDAFIAGSSVDREDLPIFDEGIEGIVEGPAIRLGMTNTLQTRRGGPGRTRNVDWIRLRTDLVFNDTEDNDDALFRRGDEEQTIPRFFDYRPEYAVGGDHFYTELMWLVSDTLGVYGELTHSLELDEVVQWRVGGTLQHTPRLSTFANYQELDILDTKLLTYGFNYDLTTKYSVSVAHRIDLSENESRRLRLGLERRLPRWRVQVLADIDEIDNDYTLGVFLRPEGLAGPPIGGRLFDTRER